MRELVIENLRKTLGGNEVLKGVSLRVKPGELVALLGQSGSGKTTILRAVAGLEPPDGGRIVLGQQVLFDQREGVDVPPEKRGLGLVFQSYALWPNRTVFENVAYGLKLRGVAAADTKKQVEAVLDRLGLGPFGPRLPHQLSGGQQQRVALARALVYQPPVLLMDEPLSNLDAKLREEARAWLRELVVQSGLSGLYVTHDQVEAMAVADRILFLREGRIEQQGTPEEIYADPQSAAAADFMGSNNRVPGRIGAIEEGWARLDGAGFSLWGQARGTLHVGARATGFIRVERLRFANGPGDHVLEVPLEAVLYLGERYEFVLKLGATRLRAWGPERRAPGPAFLHFPPGDLWVFAD